MLSQEKMDADDKSWRLAQGKLRGLPIYYRVRTGLESKISPQSHPERFYITWSFEGENESGLPDESINSQMAEFEDALMDRLGKEDLCIIYSICTYNSAREWTAYTSSSERTVEAFNEVASAFGRLPIELRAEDDPQWEDYRQLLRKLGIESL